MPVEAEQGTGEESQEAASIVEEQPEREERATDASLSSLFRQDEDESFEEETEETAALEAADTPAAVETTNTAPALPPEYQARIDAILEKQGELTATNTILAQRLEQLGRPQAAPSNEDEIDIDELNAQLQANPGKAVLDLINKLGPKIARRSETSAARIASEISGTQAAYNSDRTRAEAEFVDYFGKNPEFDKLADKYFDEFTANSPVVSAQGHRYHRGAVYAAMSAAYGDLVRRGKIKPGADNGVQLRERKAAPVNNTLTPSNKPGNTSDDVVFAGLSASEVKGMKKAAAALGVPWNDYKADFLRSAKRDPHYGGRRG